MKREIYLTGFPQLLVFFGRIDHRIINTVLPHLHSGLSFKEGEGVTTFWQRRTMIILAVGVTFGAVATGLPASSFSSAIALAIGIGLQNIPERMAISLPLRREVMSTWKSFWYGQLSGIVEPLFCVTGVSAVLFARSILPYALAFAADTMIFVVVEELIPE